MLEETIKTIFYLIILSQIGCAAALVPESNDPRTKIKQATILFNEQGRPVGAITILNQAIPLAIKNGDKKSEAEAEFYIGEIYKAPGPRDEKLRNPPLALEHYKKSISAYNEIKLYKHASFVSWNASGAYDLLNDKMGICNSLLDARKSHEKTGASEADTLPAPFANGKLLEAIQFQIKKNKCK
jgi:tetratricopeptide (TPR) repeat protein